MKILHILLLSGAAFGLAACGGGGGSGPGLAGPGSSSSSSGSISSSSSSSSSSSGSSASSSSGSVTGSNVLPITVNLGPDAPQSNYANGVFASITVCIPGSGTCKTIPYVLIDTGSYGLRLLASTVQGLGLPAESNGNGLTTAECTVFADGFTWGPVVTADIELGGLVAHGVPVNLLGSSSYAAAPSGCSSGNGQEEDTAATLGTNGILGIGPLQYDCPGCASQAYYNGYWNCASGSCSPTTQPLAAQVQNPVALLDTDNNGVVVELPSISDSGAAGASGSVIFGIGTRSNNALGSAQVIASDEAANFTTTYKGSSYDESFIDSGSNGYFFADSSLQNCSEATGFYCPSSTVSLSAVMKGENGVQVTVPFLVANAETLFNANNGNDAAFNDLGGTTGSTLDQSFDWGMPFFYGRTIFFAIENKTTPGGTGPYYAY